MIDATRLRLLQTMGIDVYLPRTPAASGLAGFPSVGSAGGVTAASGVQGGVALVVVRPSAMRDAARFAHFFQHLPRALGIDADAIAWRDVDAEGHVADVIQADSYLVFGAAAARALGAQLSTAQQGAATIAVTAESAQLLGSAADKRALWQTLKPIARRVREAAR
ncbi:MAG: hypothetical protein JSR65_00310 [Proteobacteria bacterium]|nr:hypothetical protein [Pseudomonadota bacterium]